MEHRQVADHRGQQTGGTRCVTADRDRRKGPQLNEFRAVVDQTVGAQELGQPHVADRLEVWLRRGLRARQLAAAEGLSRRSTAASEPVPMRVAA